MAEQQEQQPVPAPIDPAQRDQELREMAARMAAENEAKKPPTADQVPAPTAQPIKYLFQGKEVVYNSHEEAQSDINRYIEATQARIAALERERPTPAEEKPAQTTVDPEKFIKEFVADPVGSLSKIVEERVGKAIQPTREQLAQIEQAHAVDQFRAANPEYEPNQHNNQVISQIIQQRKWPVSADSLDAAYALAAKNKLLQTTEKQQVEQQERRPLPSLPRSAPQSQMSEQEFRNHLATLPKEQLERMRESRRRPS